MSCRIDLWLATPSAARFFRPEQLSHLESGRWRAMRSARRRRDWEVSRALLMHVNPEPDAVTSLSHSNGYAALALVRDTARLPSKPSLGVDLEAMRPRDFSALSRFAYHASERCDDAETFYARWTLKEALMKASGAPLFQILRGSVDAALAPRPESFRRTFVPRDALMLSVVAIFSAGASPLVVEIVTHEWPQQTKNQWTLLA